MKRCFIYISLLFLSHQLLLHYERLDELLSKIKCCCEYDPRYFVKLVVLKQLDWMKSHLIEEAALNLLISTATICKARRLRTLDILVGITELQCICVCIVALYYCLIITIPVTKTDFNSGLNRDI